MDGEICDHLKFGSYFLSVLPGSHHVRVTAHHLTSGPVLGDDLFVHVDPGQILTLNYSATAIPLPGFVSAKNHLTVGAARAIGVGPPSPWATGFRHVPGSTPDPVAGLAWWAGRDSVEGPVSPATPHRSPMWPHPQERRWVRRRSRARRSAAPR